MGAAPLCWGSDAPFDPRQQILFTSLTILSMLLAVTGIRAMFLIKWRDATHPSILMGVTAIAVGMTAVPLRCAGHPEQGPPHAGFFFAITLVALLFASSSVATAVGRMGPDRFGGWASAARLPSQELDLQAFSPNLGPECLDDIANAYKGLWEAIQAAHSDGICTRHLIRSQVDRLRRLADRVGFAPTDDAIRADADAFDRKARRAARSLDSAAARYIGSQCYRRFAAAVTVANHRRDG